MEIQDFKSKGKKMTEEQWKQKAEELGYGKMPVHTFILFAEIMGWVEYGVADVWKEKANV